MDYGGKTRDQTQGDFKDNSNVVLNMMDKTLCNLIYFDEPLPPLPPEQNQYNN